MKKIIISGGLGYIGSGVAYQLIKAGHNVTIIDHMQKPKPEILATLKNAGKFKLVKADLKDINLVKTLLKNQTFDLAFHFAAYTEVGLSVTQPIRFLNNNSVGSQNFFTVLINECEVKNIIFSSTAALYGKPDSLPIKESSEIRPESPYAISKKITEEMLACYSEFLKINVVALRYFNPAGSFDGILGERHQPESHLIPRLLHGFLDSSFELKVFGSDYNTKDGTAIRDYIHIKDLVSAHIDSMGFIENNVGFNTFNVGTGQGATILEVIKTAEKVTGKKLNYKIVERRAGDLEELIADPTKINNVMGWKAKHNLYDIIESAWEWELIRPHSDYA